MPQPGEADQGDLKTAPSSPSLSLQLHQEFAAFRSTLLTDVKSLLQAALQEVLDQHGVLIKGQETTLKQYIDEASGHVQAASDYLYYGSYEGEGQTQMTAQVAATNYDVKMQPLILEGHGETTEVPGYGEAVERGLNTATPASKSVKLPDPQYLRSRRASHKQGEIQQSKLVTGSSRRMLLPKPELPIARGANTKMVLFGGGPVSSAAILKDKTAMDQDPYDVSAFYKTSGIAQRIARSGWFNHTTLVMLFLNLVFIAFDANTETDWYIVFQQLFCAFFVVEFLIRFMAFSGELKGYKRDFWFKYDALLVLLMIFESWIMPLMLLIAKQDVDRRDGFVQVVRVLRTLRTVRLARAFPEMVTMVKGMLAAFWALLSTFVMLTLLVYVCAIVMHSILQDELDLSKYWATLPDALWTLIIHGVFLDNVSVVMRSLLDGGHTVAVLFFSLFVLVSAAVVMNMLLGIVLEAVRQVSLAEKENDARAKVRNRLLRRLREVDMDGRGEINKEQLLVILADAEVAALLKELEVDIPHLLEVQDMLFEGDGNQVLRIAQVMDTILELRGNRSTTIQDMVDGHTFARWSVNRQLEYQTTLLKEFMQQMVERLAWQLRPSGPTRQGQLNNAASNQLLDSLTSWMSNNKANGQ